MLRGRGGLTLALVGIGLAACTGQTASEATSMAPASSLTLRSPAFTDGGPIPPQHTCDGDDASPPLAWEGVPGGTDSFALLVTDPDAGGFVHWVLADIPGDLRELPEGQGDAIGVAGGNDFGGTGWRGPCPPSGEHRYEFRLFAVPAPLGLGASPTADAVRRAVSGNALGEAVLTGVYARE